MIFSHVIRRTLILSSSWNTLTTIIRYQVIREELLTLLTNIFLQWAQIWQISYLQLSSALDFLNASDTRITSFAFDLVIPDKVKQEISRIPNGKSHGLHSCPTKILKSSANVISSTLAQMINLSISTGVYPKKLKMSKIVLIFKADDNTDASNYRPISLLSNFNRIFET